MNERPIVLVGGLDDEHVVAVYEGLRALGEDPFVVDPRKFPSTLPITLGAAATSIEVDGRDVGLPRSVYVRSVHADPLGFRSDVEVSMTRDWRRTSAMLRERSAQLCSVLLRWEGLGVPIYNGLRAQTNLTKPYQLSVLEAAGLPVPATLWSNDPERVAEFAQGRSIIYKPISGGALTRCLEPVDLTPERMARLASAPVCFQERLPGRDLRVYVLDSVVLCALAIATDAVDFRGSEKGVIPVALEDSVLQACVRATRILGLRFTGMDLKEDRCGRPVFLELNASPMFLGFESRSGAAVGRPLCLRLAAGAP